MAGGAGLHLFTTPLAQFTSLVTAAICVAAMIWGRWPERAGALVAAVNWMASALLQDRRPGHHAQPAVFAADLAMLAALVLIAMRWRRSWVLWSAASALLLNFTDLSLLLDARIQLWSYVTASYVWGLGVVVALGAGVAFEGRHPAPILTFGLAAGRSGGG